MSRIHSENLCFSCITHGSHFTHSRRKKAHHASRITQTYWGPFWMVSVVNALLKLQTLRHLFLKIFNRSVYFHWYLSTCMNLAMIALFLKILWPILNLGLDCRIFRLGPTKKSVQLFRENTAKWIIVKVKKFVASSGHPNWGGILAFFRLDPPIQVGLRSSPFLNHWYERCCQAVKQAMLITNKPSQRGCIMLTISISHFHASPWVINYS